MSLMMCSYGTEFEFVHLRLLIGCHEQLRNYTVLKLGAFSKAVVTLTIAHRGTDLNKPLIENTIYDL